MILKNKIIKVLKNCFDPEIPIDLWNLGLIYDIKLSDDNEKKTNVHIIMSLTTPGCSMGNIMAEDIKKQLSEIEAINTVNVEVTFDPPWDPKMMTDFARKKLGFEPTKAPQNDQKIKMEWE